MPTKLTTFGKVTGVEGRVSWVSQTTYPKEAEPQRSPILGFPVSVYTLRRRTIPMVAYMGRCRVLGGQPRHCILRNASRGLSATAEVFMIICVLKFFHCFSFENVVLSCYIPV